MRYMGDFFYESLVHSSKKSTSDMRENLEQYDTDNN